MVSCGRSRSVVVSRLEVKPPGDALVTIMTFILVSCKFCKNWRVVIGVLSASDINDNMVIVLFIAFIVMVIVNRHRGIGYWHVCLIHPIILRFRLVFTLSTVFYLISEQSA